MNHTVISKETYIYIYIYTQYLLLITNTAIMYNECTLNCGLNICGSRRNFFTKRNLCKYGLKVFVVAIIFCCHSVNFLAFALHSFHTSHSLLLLSVLLLLLLLSFLLLLLMLLLLLLLLISFCCCCCC